MKKTVAFCLLLFMALLLVQLVSAGGCGQNCSQVSRSVVVTDVSVNWVPGGSSGAGASNRVPTALCTEVTPCANADTLSACEGFQQACTSTVNELNAIVLNKTGSTFSETYKKSFQNTVVTTGTYVDTGDGKTGAFVLVATKNGTRICQNGIKNAVSTNFLNALVLRVVPSQGYTDIAVQGDRAATNDNQALFVFRVNLTDCSLIRQEGVRWLATWRVFDAADDSTSSIEGNNSILVGRYLSTNDRAFFVPVLSNLSMGAFSSTVVAVANAVGYDDLQNKFFVVGYNVLVGWGFIFRIAPGNIINTAYEAQRSYTEGGSAVKLEEINVYNGAALVGGDRTVGTTNPLFIDLNTTAGSWPGTSGIINARYINLSEGAVNTLAPVRSGSNVYAAFRNSVSSVAYLYEFNSTFGVTNLFGVQNMTPLAIEPGTTQLHVGGNDISGTAALYMIFDSTGIKSQILLDNLTLTGKKPMIDPTDNFFFGGQTSAGDYGLEILGQQQPIVYSATNPNGTVRFTTDKQVRIQTMNPNINILNFQLTWQNFTGVFDTSAGTCVGCRYDLSNGTCQAEVEKVWGMFKKYRLDIQLSTAAPLNFTNLTMYCRDANQTVLAHPNCTTLINSTNYLYNDTGCVQWQATAGRSWLSTWPNNANGLAINLNGTTSINITMGNITPWNGCEMIACEIYGEWKPGNTQNFVMNKTITVTAY